jgi:hypothetical protein
MSVCLFSQESLSSADANPHIYRTGTKLVLTARWWGLFATGTMEVLGKTEFRGRDVILVRSQVTELGGFLGFIVKFLRIYKESNTFDSYIDPDTLMTVRYEAYKLNDNGSKKLTEHVYFDRKLSRVVSLEDNKTIMSNVAPDIQDAFSVSLALLYRFNTEKLFVGKRFELNLYGYREAFKVDLEVTRLTMTDGTSVYTLEIEELPAVFKHPASVSFEVTDIGGGLKFPTRGKCTIDVPVLPNITVKGELKEIKRARCAHPPAR